MCKWQPVDMTRWKRPARGVYMICFEAPYRHARHYIGYSPDIAARFALHCAGQGSRLTQVVVEAGITLVLVRIWRNHSRVFERSLKSNRNAPRFCPRCKSLVQVQKGVRHGRMFHLSSAS